LTWVDCRAGLPDLQALAGIKADNPYGYVHSGGQLPHPEPNQMHRRQEKEKTVSKKNVKTGGGAYISNSKINTGDGDFTGRDKTTETIINGNNNIVNSTVSQQTQYLQQIYTAIEERPHTDPLEKALVDEIKAEDDKGEQADESFIARRMRNIQRMAPDILEVVLATIANPIAGFGVVAKKVAEKMKTEAA
jgi:hypothetical protein